MAGFGFDKIGELISKVEQQVANSGGDTNQDGKINTGNEKSIFAGELQEAIKNEELSNKNAMKIWGLYVERGNDSVSEKPTSLPKTKTMSTGETVSDGDTVQTVININNNITINLTIKADFNEAIQHLIDGQKDAINELKALFEKYLNEYKISNQEFLEEFIKNILVSIIGETGLGNIGEILNKILQAIGETKATIDNLQATIIKMAEDNLKFYNNMNVKMDTLLELIKTEADKSAENQERQIEMLDTITNVLNKLSQDFGTFQTQIASDLNTLITLVQNGQMTMEELMNILEAIEADTSENAQVSQNILEEIVKGNDTSEAILEILTAINTELAGLSEEVKSGMLSIVNQLVEQGASMDDIKALLAEIKADTSEGNQLSLQILETINALGSDVASSLTNILATINAGGGSVDNTPVIELLQNILNQIKQNGAENKEGFKAVIDAISKLGVDMAAQMTQIMEAINANGENSEAIKVILNQILAQAQANGAENKEGFRAVLDLLANISSSGSVGITQMETLLSEIKTLLQGNNDKLDTVITNQNTIIMILNSFKAEVSASLNYFGTEVGQGIIKRLDELIANIEKNPDYCNVDGAALMDMLQTILVAIKNHTCECDCGGSTGGNNEGILNDLSKVLSATRKDPTGIETVKYKYKGQEYKVGEKFMEGKNIKIVGKNRLYDTSGILGKKF